MDSVSQGGVYPKAGQSEAQGKKEQRPSVRSLEPTPIIVTGTIELSRYSLMISLSLK